MNNFKNIVYSHSEYFDILDIFLEQQKKFGIENILVFSDKKYNDENEHLIYNENDAYSERLKKCLEKVKEDIILYQHEDMFLYKKPNINKVKKYINILKDSNYSFIRLCKTGDCVLSKSNLLSSLWEIDPTSKDFFALQPTIWKRKNLISFLEKSNKCSGWDLELNSGKINSSIKGLLHYDGEAARGGHFNSCVWPYVATAIVKGGWNFREYSTELSRIKKIKKSKRQHAVW